MVMTVGPALVLSLAGAERGDGAEPAALPPASPVATTRALSLAITSRTATSTVERAGSWQRLPAAPLTASAPPDAVWTGKEMLVFKLINADPFEPGSRMTAAGAAYNPATRTWRRLPALPAREKGLLEGGILVAWTGSEALVAGVVNGAYNPASDRWRPISTPDKGASAPAVSLWDPVWAWTGRELLVWGGRRIDTALASGAAYSPSTDTWRALPASPLAARAGADDVWTGKELIILGGHELGGNGPLAVLDDAAAYNPTTRSWRRLRPMPAARSGATVTWTGTEVLVVGGRGGIRTDRLSAPCACALAYNLATNRWRSLPDMEVGRDDHAAVWTGRQLLVWGGDTDRGTIVVYPRRGVVFDPARNRWSPMPSSPLRGRANPLAVWTGSRLIIMGGEEFGVRGAGEFSDAAAYIP
jgi:hypothetical protein